MLHIVENGWWLLPREANNDFRYPDFSYPVFLKARLKNETGGWSNLTHRGQATVTDKHLVFGDLVYDSNLVFLEITDVVDAMDLDDARRGVELAFEGKRLPRSASDEKKNAFKEAKNFLKVKKLKK